MQSVYVAAHARSERPQAASSDPALRPGLGTVHRHREYWSPHPSSYEEIHQ
ncbi:hypothetical protein [Tsukamurella sputi]|uniref:hypothetical protein n=1 Tax=Tsukamurella sputi TaxID=2591848 RepID=UPI0013158B74|nr:hypothetical protein [Tsukamurella sputi]